MANYQLLKADIDAKVYQNGQQEITGANLNSVLNAMVTTLGAEYQFAGVATTATNPGTLDAKVFYIANGKGTYTNFGSIEVTEDEVVVLYWDTAWHKEATGIASHEKLTELESQVIYDVTTNNGGATFASLSALLSSENLSTLIPTSVRCGGMSIRFVHSSDNKYVQYILKLSTFTTTQFAHPANWQGVDEEATKNSKNLIESSGVVDFTQYANKQLLPIQTAQTTQSSGSVDLIISNNWTKGERIFFKVQLNGLVSSSLHIQYLSANGNYYDIPGAQQIEDNVEQELIIPADTTNIRLYAYSSSISQYGILTTLYIKSGGVVEQNRLFNDRLDILEEDANIRMYNKIQDTSTPDVNIEKEFEGDFNEDDILSINFETQGAWISNAHLQFLSANGKYYDIPNVATFENGKEQIIKLGVTTSKLRLYVYRTSITTSNDYTFTLYSSNNVIQSYKTKNIDVRTMLTYFGDKISLKQKADYKYIFDLRDAGVYNQGSAIYGNYLFAFHTGNAEVDVYDLTTNTLVQTISVSDNPQGENHANNADFGVAFADASDLFPLLYVTTNLNDEIWVYRVSGTIGNLVMTKHQVISLNTSEIGIYSIGSFAVDKENNKIVFTGYKNANYDVSVNNPGVIGYFEIPVTSSDIQVASADVHFKEVPWVYAFQGCFAVAGKIYSAFGNTHVSAGICVYDYANGIVLNKIAISVADFGDYFEPEGLCEYNGDIIMTSQHLKVYKLAF